MADHDHPELGGRLDRLQRQVDGYVSVALFDERDRVVRESFRRVEQKIDTVARAVTDLRVDFENSELERRNNARSLRNLVLGAVFSGIVSLVVAVIIAISVTHP